MSNSINIEKKATVKTEAFMSYLNEVKRHEQLTESEEVELAERIQNGDQKAREKLITANLRFVISVAKQYRPGGTQITLNDLVSAGNIGLVKAAENFDHTRGFKFISYAVWKIRSEITTYIHRHNRQIRQPLNIEQDLKKKNEFEHKFYAKHGRQPTTEEIQAEVNVSDRAIKDKTQVIRGDQPMTHDQEKTGWDVFADNKSAEEITEKTDAQNAVSEALNNNGLNKVEKYVIEHYYGLSGKKRMNYEKLREALGYKTVENVRIKHRHALKKLKKSEYLKEFVE